MKAIPEPPWLFCKPPVGDIHVNVLGEGREHNRTIVGVYTQLTLVPTCCCPSLGCIVLPIQMPLMALCHDNKPVIYSDH